jgi:hypothetical protein
MSTSYNGWSASPSLATRPLVVAGESFVPGVRDNDDVYTVLRYVSEQVHKRVEPIVRSDWHQMDDWGYNYRASTGNAYALSCHASGTAIDYNATRHPYGVRGTFTAAQISEVHRILDEVRVVEWGNDWNLPDGMHFEIDGSYAEVAAAAERIRQNQGEPPMADSDVILQKLKELDNKVERGNEQNSRIINKLNKSREREVVMQEELAEILDQLDADSPVRRKLNTIIAKLKEHTAEDPDAEA